MADNHEEWRPPVYSTAMLNPNMVVGICEFCGTVVWNPESHTTWHLQLWTVLSKIVDIPSGLPWKEFEEKALRNLGENTVLYPGISPVRHYGTTKALCGTNSIYMSTIWDQVSCNVCRAAHNVPVKEKIPPSFPEFGIKPKKTDAAILEALRVLAVKWQGNHYGDTLSKFLEGKFD